MHIYALTIFLASCLIFQVQPVIAKMILPWYGGSAAVWIVCSLFFQAMLLLGYLYADLSIRSLQPRIQSAVHCTLLAGSLFILPCIPGAQWKPSGTSLPALQILALLAVTVGLPYFTLSATTPLLQAWYARDGGAVLPYRFFALSNFGSMLALASYPFLIEPAMSATRQAYVWSSFYVLFAVLCGWVGMRKRRSGMLPLSKDESKENPDWARKLQWLVLSTCSSALLLSVTNYLCQDVASIPFLWILPLTVYLLSFVLCFDRPQWYRRTIWVWAVALAFAAMAYRLLSPVPKLRFEIPIFTVGLFICCVFLHGELVLARPGISKLTVFYAIVALGGALGGVAVGLVAPAIFPGYYELPIAMLACGAIGLFAVYRRSWIADAVWIVLITILTTVLGTHIKAQISSARVIGRNFYGCLRVVDVKVPGKTESARYLFHGATLHGLQSLAAGRQREPLAYYGRESGVALAIEGTRKPGQRVGVIGLGAGTIAAYGASGDYYRFYEINPLVVQLAREHFSYLRDSPATIEIAQGDARLSLEREPAQGYDVLAVDAFSGDAIPIHLLTREAFVIYHRHLKPGGILALHISNRYLDLRPIIARIAQSRGEEARLVVSKGDRAYLKGAIWVLVLDPGGLSSKPGLAQASVRLETPAPGALWTDSYSNLLAAMM